MQLADIRLYVIKTTEQAVEGIQRVVSSLCLHGTLFDYNSHSKYTTIYLLGTAVTVLVDF